MPAKVGLKPDAVLRMSMHLPSGGWLVVETSAKLVDVVGVRATDGKQSFPTALCGEGLYLDLSVLVEWWKKLSSSATGASQAMPINDVHAEEDGMLFKCSKTHWFCCI